ncbi:hypothetical protein [Sorangium sp. So ce1024]|uniref:hypothetical protein n=1 Tax=unclassified Sorangium TaxID=2621164 RepID=UPI003F0EF9CC
MPAARSPLPSAPPFGEEDDDIPPDDPVVVAHVERALAPYRDLLPAEAREACEEVLVMMLTTHPEVAPMVNRLRRAAAVQRSGTRPRDVAPPAREDAARAGRPRHGGRR